MKPSSSYSPSKNSTHSSLSDLFHSIFRSRSLYLSLLLSHFPNMYRNVSIVDDRLTFIKRKQNSCAHQKTQKTSASVLKLYEKSIYRSPIVTIALFSVQHTCLRCSLLSFLSPSFSLSISLCQSIYRPVSQSIALYLPLYLSVHLYVFHLSLSPSQVLSIDLRTKFLILLRLAKKTIRKDTAIIIYRNLKKMQTKN